MAFEHNEKFINRKLFVLVLCFVILYSCRILFLENDLPAFGIGLYQPKDEGRYSMMALDYLNYGNLYECGEYEIYTPPTFRVNVLQNLLQLICMKIMGKNYYGFRFPSFLVSILSVLICIRIVYCLFKCYYKLSELYYSVVFFLLLYFLTDFPYLVTGKCAESSIYRTFTIAVSIWMIFETAIDEQIRFFTLGVISVFSIFFVYISNFTILLTVLCIIVFMLFRHTDYQKIKATISGIIIGCVCSEVYYLGVWKIGALQNLLASVNSFSDRIILDKTQTSASMKGIQGFFSFWGSNIFFFNTFVLVLFLWSLTVFIKFSLKQKDKKLYFLVIMLIAFIAQMTIINDYNERKSITIVPLVISIIVMGIIIYKRENYAGKIVNTGFVCSVIFTILSCAIAFFRRIELDYLCDFETTDLIILIFTNILVCLMSVFLYRFLSSGRKMLMSLLVKAICILVISENLFFDFKYLYLYSLYTEKEAMAGIGEIIGDNYVIASYAIDFCLYNDIKPISNTNDKYQEYIECDDIYYMIDYAEGAKVRFILPKESYVEVAVFPRSIKCLGSYWPIAVFRKT